MSSTSTSSADPDIGNWRSRTSPIVCTTWIYPALRQVFRPLRACLDRLEFRHARHRAMRDVGARLCASRSSRLNRRVALLTHLHGNPTIEESKSAVNRALFAFYRAVVARRISATLAVSVALEHAVRGSALAGGHPVHYAPNPARSLESGTLYEPGKPPRFVSVGRLSRQKGHDVLLAAFAEVLLVHADAHLDIVGSGGRRSRAEGLGGPSSPRRARAVPRLRVPTRRA